MIPGASGCFCGGQWTEDHTLVLDFSQKHRQFRRRCFSLFCSMWLVFRCFGFGMAQVIGRYRCCFHLALSPIHPDATDVKFLGVWVWVFFR